MMHNSRMTTTNTTNDWKAIRHPFGGGYAVYRKTKAGRDFVMNTVQAAPTIQGFPTREQAAEVARQKNNAEFTKHRDRFNAIEAAAWEFHSTNPEPFDMMGSAYQNALDTWREQPSRGEERTEAFYEFAFASLESNLCDEGSEKTREWFKAQGVRW